MVLRCIREILRPDSSANDAATVTTPSPPIRLAKDRPIAAGILHHKACYTNSGGRGKQRFMEWRYAPGCCGERQHQQ